MSGEENAPLIESRTDLIEVMAVGGKPKAEWRIGTEHEKHVYRKGPIRPVSYEGSDGIHALLDGIETRTGWHPFFDRGNPIGLRNMGAIGGISLEPGGQFELSVNGRAQQWPARLDLSAGDVVEVTPGPSGNYGYLRFDQEIAVPPLLADWLVALPVSSSPMPSTGTRE